MYLYWIQFKNINDNDAFHLGSLLKITIGRSTAGKLINLYFVQMKLTSEHQLIVFRKPFYNGSSTPWLSNMLNRVN